jgi:hypothetical protein
LSLADGSGVRIRVGGYTGPLAARRAAVALMLLPQLGAFSKLFHLDSVCSLEGRARIGPQHVVVDPSADGADGAHRLDRCIDFRVSGHDRLRWIRHTPAINRRRAGKEKPRANDRPGLLCAATSITNLADRDCSKG